MEENGSTKKYLILVIIAMAIIIIILSGFILYKFPIQNVFPVTPVSAPKPTPTPASPIADVTLSPNNQVVVLSLGQTPSFSLTISQNGYGTVVFPCSVTIVPSVQVLNGIYTSPPFLYNYGTISSNSYYPWVPNPSQPETISFYAVVQDSTGAKITSNTITVQYE